MRWTQDNLATFKELECAMLAAWRSDPSLSDHTAARAYEAAHQVYDAQARGRRGRPLNLGGHDKAAFDKVLGSCEYLLGRGPRPEKSPAEIPPIPLAQLVECLRELARSVHRHAGVGGAQSYLRYVAKFLPGS